MSDINATEPADGDVTPAPEGPTTITLVRFSQAEEIQIEDGQTIEEVLEEQGVPADAAIRFRGENLDGDARSVVLAPGDTVIATAPRVSHG